MTDTYSTRSDSAEVANGSTFLSGVVDDSITTSVYQPPIILGGMIDFSITHQASMYRAEASHAHTHGVLQSLRRPQ
ncbi:hypothetical protein [Singulisphaera sp. GP187]|uniref:hypothetical protein n=1 Tax=Singulisphaera sp. GP187 TaxID=1882752 RepID=UPI0009409376|nr:hypothetical protein [Singulisphaera sp. GP187]